jgi:hypothetical protein
MDLNQIFKTHLEQLFNQNFSSPHYTFENEYSSLRDFGKSRTKNTLILAILSPQNSTSVNVLNISGDLINIINLNIFISL